jgi:hypothetical protein
MLIRLAEECECAADKAQGAKSIGREPLDYLRAAANALRSVAHMAQQESETVGLLR